MHRYLTRFFFLLLSLLGLPLAAAYDTYHLRLDDGDKYKPDSAQMVLYLAAREGAVTRMMLASGSTPTVAHTYFVAYAHPPANLQVPAVFREMAVSLSPEAITGSAVLTHTGNAGVARSVELNLSIAEDSIGGIITVDGMEHAASGRVFRNADQRARQAFPSGAAWPRKMGPHDANVATAHGAPLLEDLADFAPVWISEEVIPASAKMIKFISGPAGGSTGPVVADERVFLSYYVPSGPTALDYVGRMLALPPWNLLDADDVVLAMDARTGETLWKQVFPLRGYNLGSP